MSIQAIETEYNGYRFRSAAAAAAAAAGAGAGARKQANKMMCDIIRQYVNLDGSAR